MITRVLLLVLGLFHAANGLAMLLVPTIWANVVVHDLTPSPLEFHFIADIGMVLLASGAALIWSVRPGILYAPWAIAGAAWPALHAALHMREWAMDGLPATIGDILNEGVGVVLAGVVGVALAFSRQHAGDAP